MQLSTLLLRVFAAAAALGVAAAWASTGCASVAVKARRHVMAGKGTYVRVKVTNSGTSALTNITLSVSAVGQSLSPGSPFARSPFPPPPACRLICPHTWNMRRPRRSRSNGPLMRGAMPWSGRRLTWPPRSARTSASKWSSPSARPRLPGHGHERGGFVHRHWAERRHRCQEGQEDVPPHDCSVFRALVCSFFEALIGSLVCAVVYALLGSLSCSCCSCATRDVYLNLGFRFYSEWSRYNLSLRNSKSRWGDHHLICEMVWYSHIIQSNSPHPGCVRRILPSRGSN